jgi:hypothetical protein
MPASYQNQSAAQYVGWPSKAIAAANVSGEGTVRRQAELVGEPLNTLATAILRAYLGTGSAWPAELSTKIHGVAIIPDRSLRF